MHPPRFFAVSAASMLCLVAAPGHADKFIVHDVASVSVSPNRPDAGELATVTCTYVPAGSVQIGKGSPFYSVEHKQDKAYWWGVPIQITLNGRGIGGSNVSGFLDKKGSQTATVKLDPSLADTNVKFGCEIDPFKEIHNSQKTITRHIGIGSYAYLVKPFDFLPTDLVMRVSPRSQRPTGQLHESRPAQIQAGHALNQSLHGPANKPAIPTIQEGTAVEFFCKWRANPVISDTTRSIRTSGQIVIDGRTYRTFPMAVSGKYANEQFLNAEPGIGGCGPSQEYKCHAQGEIGPIRWIAHGGGVHTIRCKVDSNGTGELAKLLYNNTLSKRVRVPLTASLHRPIHLPPRMRPHVSPGPFPRPRLNPNTKGNSTPLKQQQTTHG